MLTSNRRIENITDAIHVVIGDGESRGDKDVRSIKNLIVHRRIRDCSERGSANGECNTLIPRGDGWTILKGYCCDYGTSIEDCKGFGLHNLTEDNGEEDHSDKFKGLHRELNLTQLTGDRLLPCPNK